MDNITRICRKCGQEKPLSEFVRDKTCASGYRHTCKQCDRECKRKWYAENAEKRRERKRKWYAENAEKRREWNRKWYAENPEKCREWNRKWLIAHPEKVREYKRKYYLANAEKFTERCRKWRIANPEKCRERNRKRGINDCKSLTDRYLRDKLRRNNLPITPETIDYKRIQLKLYREIKKQTDYERN